MKKWGFPGGSGVKNLPANAGDMGLIPGLERSPGEGSGIPLQYSCLGNPMDRGAWTGYSPWGLKESDMTKQLTHTHTHTHTHTPQEAGVKAEVGRAGKEAKPAWGFLVALVLPECTWSLHQCSSALGELRHKGKKSKGQIFPVLPVFQKVSIPPTSRLHMQQGNPSLGDKTWSCCQSSDRAGARGMWAERV